MNPIGQKVAQTMQASRALSNAQIPKTGMQTAIGQISTRFIQTANPKAIKSLSSIQSLQAANFSSKTTGAQSAKFSFLESSEMVPIKQMQTALKEHARKFDSEGLAGKTVSEFTTVSFNLEIASGKEEVDLCKSMVHSALQDYIDLFQPTVHPDNNPSPEAVESFKNIIALKDKTLQFLANYKRG
jgi:hypothetical protein